MKKADWRSRLGIPLNASVDVWTTLRLPEGLVPAVAKADAGPEATSAELRTQIEADPGWKAISPRAEAVPPWVETAASIHHPSTFFIGGAPAGVELEGMAWRTADGIILSASADEAPGHLELVTGDVRWFAAVDDGRLVVLRSAAFDAAEPEPWVPPPDQAVLLPGIELLHEFSTALEAAAPPEASGLAGADAASFAEVVRVGWLLAFCVEGFANPIDAIRSYPGPAVASWWLVVPESWLERLEAAAVRSASKLLGKLVDAPPDGLDRPEALRVARWRLRLEGVRQALVASPSRPARLDALLEEMDETAARFCDETGHALLESLPERNGIPTAGEDWLLHQVPIPRVQGVPLELPWWVPAST